MDSIPVPVPMSQSMYRLNDEALQRGRDVIAGKFTDPSDLDDTSSHIANIKKQLLLAESQLNVAVQGKLEALKRAADIMDESAAKLTHLSKTLHSIDERIERTNTVISNFEYLRRVHHARDNIANVLTRVEFFARVPDKAKGLEKLLEADPGRLKDVFLEAIKLEALRDALIKEIKVSRHRRSSTAGLSTSSKSGTSSKGDYSADTYKRIRGAVEEHLRFVPELMKSIRERLMSNIERFMELGIEAPSELVMSFEIVEMHQEYISRRVAQARAKALEYGLEENALVKDTNENLVADVKKRLYRILTEKVESRFIVAKEDKKGDSSAGVEAALNAATQLISMATEFKNEVVPCIPPFYEPMAIFIDAFEEYFLPELSTLVEDTSKLQVSDFLQIIDWIEYYKAQMEGYECSDRPSIKELTSIAGDMMNEYLVRVRNQVMEWFSNIKKLPVEIKKTNDDKLITSHPEEMFNVIHMQLVVAKEKLPREHLKDVVNTCLQALREVQRQSYDNMSQNLSTLDVEMLCATINDNERLQSKCDEFRESILPLVAQPDHRELLESMLGDVSTEYVAIAVNAVGFLCRGVLGDLDDPVFSRLFIAEWEKGEERLVPILTATLADYFQDIRLWLPEFYYALFVKRTFEMTVGCYLMTLRKVANGTFHFTNELVAAAMVQRDRKLLEEFFQEYVEVLKESGLRPKAHHSHQADSSDDESTLVESHLESLKCLATIISATHISGAILDIKALLYVFGGDGLKLVHSVIWSNPGMSKAEKQQNVEKVTKLYDQGVQQGLYSKDYSELYKDFDAMDASVALAANGKKATKSFWSIRR